MWWIAIGLLGLCSLHGFCTLLTLLLAGQYAVAGRRFCRARLPDKSRTYVRRPAAGITVLIPAFNEASRIERCLESIRASSLQPERIIVVDDGSTDDTFAIAVHVLCDCGFAEVIRLAPNGGKANALNRGLERVATPLTFTIDADSWLARDTLAQACSLLEAASHDAVACHIVISETSAGLAALQAVEYAAVLQVARLMQARLGLVTTVPGAGALYRTDTLRRMGGFLPRSAAEDTDLTLMVQRHGGSIGCSGDAVVYTTPPATFPSLLRQRERWIWGNLTALLYHAVLATPMSAKLHGLLLPWLAVSNGLAPLFWSAVLVATPTVLLSDFGWVAGTSVVLLAGMVSLRFFAAFAVVDCQRPAPGLFIGSFLLMPLIMTVAMVTGGARRLRGRVASWR